MTRRSLAIAAAAGAVAAVGVIAYLALPDDVAPPAGPTGAARGSMRPRGPQDRSAEDEVARLIAGGDRPALVEKYGAWAGKDDKRGARERILDALTAGDDPKQALEQVLAALAGDTTPVGDDPLIDYAAARMQVLWRDPGTYQYGRDLMMVQPEDKPRATLVTSLVEHTAKLTDAQDPERQRRTVLAADLVDIYPASGKDTQARILAGARRLGADDVAMALGGGAKVGDYQVVKDQLEQTEQTIIDLKTKGAEGVDHLNADQRQYLKQGERPF